MILKNRFNEFKKQFFKDTKLKADDNIEIYIAYFNAICNDQNAQFNAITMQETIIMKNTISKLK